MLASVVWTNFWSILLSRLFLLDNDTGSSSLSSSNKIEGTCVWLSVPSKIAISGVRIRGELTAPTGPGDCYSVGTTEVKWSNFAFAGVLDTGIVIEGLCVELTNECGRFWDGCVKLIGVWIRDLDLLLGVAKATGWLEIASGCCKKGSGSTY